MIEHCGQMGDIASSTVHILFLEGTIVVTEKFSVAPLVKNFLISLLMGTLRTTTVRVDKLVLMLLLLLDSSLNVLLLLCLKSYGI